MKKKEKMIKEEMRIDEIVQKHPEAADVFMNYGLHCVGCSLAGYESIEQGAMAHGMDKKTIKNMLKEVNEYVEIEKDDKDDKNPIRITKRAAVQVSKLIEDNKGSKFLRIALVEMPFGHRYGFRFEKKKKKDDVVIVKDDASFVINKKDLSKIKGSTMDYLSYIPGNGFKIYASNKNK